MKIPKIPWAKFKVPPEPSQEDHAGAVEDGQSASAGSLPDVEAKTDKSHESKDASLDRISTENNYPDSQPRDPEQWAEWGLSPPHHGGSVDQVQTVPWDSELPDLDMEVAADKALDEHPVPEDGHHEERETQEEQPEDMPDLAEQQAKLRKTKREEEEKQKAEKDAKKKAKKEGDVQAMRRPAAAKKSRKPKEPKEPKEPEESQEPKDSQEPKEMKKESKKPGKTKKSKEPKEQKKVKEPKTSKRKAQCLDDEGEGAEVLTEKEKRRVRAAKAFQTLQEAAIVGLELPGQLNGRISFTVKNPEGFGSSVGVILASESFYVSKAVPPPDWPTNCKHLKVDKNRGVTLPWGIYPAEAWGHAKTVAGWATRHGGNGGPIQKTSSRRRSK